MIALQRHTELSCLKANTNSAFTAKQVGIFLTFWANEWPAAFKVFQKLPWNFMKLLTEERYEDSLNY